uniref:Ig-like domain-containing protein n=1 Tax=Crocodylus porosus TaxID=8502 RepID=A0A7M4FUD2_CROPO
MLFLGCLSGLKPPVAVGQTKVAGVVGQEVILPCSLTRQMTSVTWKFQKRTHTTRRQESQEDIVIKYHINVFKGNILNSPCLPPMQGWAAPSPPQWSSNPSILILPEGKAPMANRSELITTNFSLKVQNLAPYDVGEYTCESGHRGDTVQLVVFGGDLQQYSPVQNKITVTWWDNKDMEVTSEQSQTDQYSLHKSGLRITDSGKWKCKINLQFKPFDLDIPFDVIVIELERKILYAAVNTTVSFSYLLNLWEVKWTGSLKAHLDWKAKADDNYREIMNFSITNQELTSPKQIKRFGVGECPPRGVSCKEPEILRLSSHLCLPLLLSTVSATPTGPLSKGAEVTLHCQLSALPLQKGLLIWHRVNGTKEESKQVIHREVEVKARTAGLWRCSFVLENKTLINHTAQTTLLGVWWIQLTLSGEGGDLKPSATSERTFNAKIKTCATPLLSWQRRAERMVRVRQDLLQNRTCQCQQ